jgi:hypothetical protein
MFIRRFRKFGYNRYRGKNGPDESRRNWNWVPWFSFLGVAYSSLAIGAIKLASPETRTVNRYFSFVVYNVTDLLVHHTYRTVLVTF